MIETARLASLTLSTSTEVSWNRIARMVAFVDDLPPIEVDADGLVLDGGHRAWAHVIAGRSTIQIVRTPPEGERTVTPAKTTEVEHWKVRVVFHRGCLHFVSLTKPRPVFSDGRLVGCEMTPHPDDTFGDTIGHLDWSAVLGLTWRRAEEGPILWRRR